jgi:hypothetical protein
MREGVSSGYVGGLPGVGKPNHGGGSGSTPPRIRFFLFITFFLKDGPKGHPTTASYSNEHTFHCIDER